MPRAAGQAADSGSADRCRKTSATSAARRARSTSRARIGIGGPRARDRALATRPFAIDWKIDVGRRRPPAAQALFRSRRRMSSSPSGAVSAKGRCHSPARSRPERRRDFAGDVTISDFGALDRPTAQELVRWKTLTLTGIDVAEHAAARLRSAPSRSTSSSRGSSSTPTRRSTCSGCSRRRPRKARRRRPRRRHRGQAAGCIASRVGTAPSRVVGASTGTRRSAGIAGDRRVDRRHQGEPRRSAVFGLLHQAELLGAPDARSPAPCRRFRPTQAGNVAVRRPRREHRAGRDTRDAESVRARALARSHGQGHRHRPAAAHALFGQVRGIRHHERRAVVRSPLQDRQSPADGVQQARARPADVRRARRQPDAPPSCRSCSRSRCSRMATAPSVSICRSRVRSTTPSSRSGASSCRSSST